MSSAQLIKFASVKPANIEWRDDLPYSLEFDDVYYSDSGALAESEHVFLKGNQLENDWLTQPQNKFNLAELGFGSGLNFFNTANLWHQKITQQAAHPHKHLHYISIEKRPFSLEDFKRSCLSWPQFDYISSKLIQSYPSTTYGRHQIYFNELNITLTLFYMPVEDALADLINESQSQQNKTQIDHWFLDGFAPSKNESMWGQKVMSSITALSKIGSRLSTYSVAGSVKKPIAEAGFKITKQVGFGRKREMLTAVLSTCHQAQTEQSKYINLKYDTPWFQQSLSEPTESVAIIGGGVAGCATAYCLSRKNIHVDIFESHSQLAQGASGAAAGIFHPQLTSDMNINSQFSWSAYLFLLNFLSELSFDEKQSIILSQGVNRCLESTKIKQQLIDLSTSLHLEQWIEEPSDFINKAKAIYFPDAAALDMSAFCSLLYSKIAVDKKTLHLNSQVSDLKFTGGYWHFKTNDKNYRYKQVIFCGAANSQLLDQLFKQPTRISRGQTCYINSAELAKSVSKTLCEKVYLVPRPDNNFHIGSTFDYVSKKNPEDRLSTESQNKILSQTAKLLAKLKLDFLSDSSFENQPLTGTFGYRLHSLDRLPLVGGVVDQIKLNNDFSNLGQKRLLRTPEYFYNQLGLWLNTAYGSHGLLYSLLASQHLTSLITNDISPINQRLAHALSPTRFAIRQLK